MPRSGPGTYSPPPGTTVSANTTIQSAWANAYTGDITTVLNSAWPVVFGGTGGSSAVSGSDAMNAQGANITAAATTDLSLATGTYVLVTGNTTITSFGTVAAGAFRRITFTGTPTITFNSTSLITPSGANIAVQAGDSIEVVSLGSGNWRIINYQSGNGISPYPPGTLYGLTLSNNVTDATNDIDIAVGAARNSIDTANIDLLTALTKRLDAVWAVGTNQGMNASGVALADGTYHLFLIKRPDTGVVDVAADTSPTGANIPANTNVAYTLRIFIGSIIRQSAAIIPFYQIGRAFWWKTPIANISANNPGSAAVSRTLTVPNGRIVGAMITALLGESTAATTRTLYLSSLAVTDVAPSIGGAFSLSLTGYTNSTVSGSFTIPTNTSNQIRSRLSGSTATTDLLITTNGWIDY